LYSCNLTPTQLGTFEYFNQLTYHFPYPCGWEASYQVEVYESNLSTGLIAGGSFDLKVTFCNSSGDCPKSYSSQIGVSKRVLICMNLPF
jgi:hypothetical protein